MTQIVCGVSICFDNSRHFRMSDFGLSTQKSANTKTFWFGVYWEKAEFGLEGSKSSHKIEEEHTAYAVCKETDRGSLN